MPILTSFPGGGGGKNLTENLILDSGAEYTGQRYGVVYSLSEQLELQQLYTVTIWGEPTEGCTFNIFPGNTGNNIMGNLNKIAEGVYSNVVVAKAFSQDDEAFRKMIDVYVMPKDNLTAPFTIHHIKMEKGKNLNPIWTPAPQDFNSIYSRLTALEAKTNPS